MQKFQSQDTPSSFLCLKIALNRDSVIYQQNHLFQTFTAKNIVNRLESLILNFYFKYVNVIKLNSF